MGVLLLALIALGIYLAITVAWWWVFVPFGGFVVLTLLAGGVSELFQPGWGQFLREWEKREGSVPVTVPGSRLGVIRMDYKEWRRAHRRSGISAADWLEGHGHPARAKEGETKITSGWRYEILAFDEAGQWTDTGSRFAATRSFQYEVGGPYGAGAGYAHIEHCMHSHSTRAEALPCLERFRQRGGAPTLADLEPKQPILTARGAYRRDMPSGWHEGEVEAWEYGVVVQGVSAQGERKAILFDWEQFESGERSLESKGPVLSLALKGEPAVIVLTGFGESGEQAWRDLLDERGVPVQDN